jgi:CRP-like cAMP-binding protein
MAVAGSGGILLDPDPPKARIKAVSNAGIEYKVKYWIDCAKVGPGKARHVVLESILQQMRHAGLELGYTRQDVYYAPMPQRQLDAGSTADRVRLLERIESFRPLSNSEREQLAAEMEMRRFPAYAHVIEQGEAGDSMLVVFEGMLKISVESNGKPLQVGVITAGDYLGEMSLLTGEPRTATAIATTDVLAFEIGKRQMEALLRERPELIDSLSQVAADRHLRNDEAFARASKVEQEVQRATLSGQIMTKVRAFFSAVFDTFESHPSLQRGEVPVSGGT